MIPLNELSKEELCELKKALTEEFETFKAKGLKLDMSRGKPAPAQLDLSNGLFDKLDLDGNFDIDKADIRNYGVLDGLTATKKIFADVLDLDTSNIIVGGASSLNLMYDCVVKAMLLGVYGGKTPWGKQDSLKFICPVPGYDRHFAITQQLGFEMINVPNTKDGVDIATIEKLVSSDPTIKGIWCVPKYGNPTGEVYSDDVVRRFASLKPAADDFRIFWDNAYAVHDFDPDNAPKLLNIFDVCKENGTEDMVYEFTSTSKITFAGGGLACIAASTNNVNHLKSQLTIQTIGFDKINQVRHARFFSGQNTIKNHMKKHAAIIKPKFDTVLKVFDSEFTGLGIATYTRPVGGYFISVDLIEGTAKRTVALCKEAGVVLTGAGATFPYGVDPIDSNIRIAPTFPECDELELASKLFCLCAKLAACEKLAK